MRKPSPAMVVALVALFSSLAGGAVAARLVTTKDVKNGSLLAKDFKRGQLPQKSAVKAARGGPNDKTAFDSSDAKEVLSLTIKAPARGFVTLTYSGTIDNQTPSTWVEVFLMQGSTRINGIEWWDAGDADGNYDQTQSNQLTVPVKKGKRTYSLRLRMSAGTANVHDPRLTAVYVPSSL